MQYYMDQNLHNFFSIATSPKNQLIEYLFIYINLILSSFVSVFKKWERKKCENYSLFETYDCTLGRVYKRDVSCWYL